MMAGAEERVYGVMEERAYGVEEEATDDNILVAEAVVEEGEQQLWAADRQPLKKLYMEAEHKLPQQYTAAELLLQAERS